MQLYPPGMLKHPTHYFRGRCPVTHTINAKVIWADTAGLGALRKSFDECAGRMLAAKTCECFDEETVLTHIHNQVAPCTELHAQLPRLNSLQVIDPNKRA